MKNWLSKPFPLVQTYKQALVISLFVGIFVTLFLYLFKPFGIDEKPSLLLYLSGYGLIAFGSVFFSMQVLPVLIPKWFNKDDWDVLKNILLMCWILLLISVFNWQYAIFLYKMLGSTLVDFKDLPIGIMEHLGMTFSVGVFPVLLINYILERQFFDQNYKLAKVVESTMDNASSIAVAYTTLEIPTDGNKIITISSQSLVLVKAEGGNYVTIFWLENDELRSQLWRITLKNLLIKIEDDQNILQCHKSYLVNRSFIMEVKGNARTLALRMKALDFEVPVSRNFPRELVEHYHLQQA